MHLTSTLPKKRFQFSNLKYLNEANPNNLLKANRIKKGLVTKNGIDRQKWRKGN